MTDFQKLEVAIRNLRNEIIKVFEPYLMKLYCVFEKLEDWWTK